MRPFSFVEYIISFGSKSFLYNPGMISIFIHLWYIIPYQFCWNGSFLAAAAEKAVVLKAWPWSLVKFQIQSQQKYFFKTLLAIQTYFFLY